MTDLTTYFVGEREYQTDGVVLLVNRAAAIHLSRLASCQKVSDSELATRAAKAPSVTLNASLLRTLLDHAHGISAVSIFIEAPDKAVLFVFDKDRFAILMPFTPDIWCDRKLPAPAHPVEANGAEQPPPPANGSNQMAEFDMGKPVVA